MGRHENEKRTLQQRDRDAAESKIREMEEDQQHAAAVTIQSHYRGLAARSTAQVEPQKLQREKRPLLALHQDISSEVEEVHQQGVIDIRRRQKQLVEMRIREFERKQQAEAATRIQNAFRRHVMRTYLRADKA